MAFATPENVVTRLGRPLSDEEEALVEDVIEDVTGLICGVLDKDDAWAAALDPVPATFRVLCVEKAIAVGSNPNNVASQSKQMGSFSHSETFRRGDGGLLLTDDERRAVRRAYFRSAAGSARVRSAVDDVLDYADDGLLNDSLGS